VTPGCSTPHTAGAGYCPECGLRLDATTPPVAPCPACGTVPEAPGAFCERCGAATPDTPAAAAPRPPAPAARPRRWSAVVSADPKLFRALRAAERGFVFPDVPDRRVPLGAAQIRIGRSDGSGPRPEVDLAGPPPDPAVSAAHAELVRRDDESWELRDLGSGNGTYVGSRRVGAGETVRLVGGEKIRLGMWSRVVLVHDADPPRGWSGFSPRRPRPGPGPGGPRR
jgi:hypothetical protein